MVKTIHEVLNTNLGAMELLDLCCTKRPLLDDGIQVINVCPGCDRRYRENYPNVTTISLWEILAANDYIKLPDYQGQPMSILDACPTRSEERVHNAIRTLLSRMNIKLIEPAKTRTKSTCCGDSFYGKLPVEQVKTLMGRRAAEMPVNEVVVYCVSCVKSVFVGNRQPRYMVDLLWGEETLPQTYEPDAWHQELNEFIHKH
ncbi:MAG: (Fe-S)-binding protein [Methanomassiliicoccales archaeon]